MNIGKINKITLDGREQLIGHITTLHIKLKFVLKENRNKQSNNAPDYHIVVKNSDGESAVGARWNKTSQKWGTEPKEYISMSFDDPSFSHALHVVAFKVGESHWDIVWSRKTAPEPNAA